MTAGSPLTPRPCVHGCGTSVVLAQRVGRAGKWSPFEAEDRDPTRPEAVNSWVLVGVQAWQPRDLVEHLHVTQEITEEAARELARGYPWHRPHTCAEREGDLA